MVVTRGFQDRTLSYALKWLIKAYFWLVEECTGCKDESRGSFPHLWGVRNYNLASAYSIRMCTMCCNHATTYNACVYSIRLYAICCNHATPCKGIVWYNTSPTRASMTRGWMARHSLVPSVPIASTPNPHLCASILVFSCASSLVFSCASSLVFLVLPSECCVFMLH